jgi:hypothetical protein
MRYEPKNPEGVLPVTMKAFILLFLVIAILDHRIKCSSVFEFLGLQQFGAEKDAYYPFEEFGGTDQYAEEDHHPGPSHLPGEAPLRMIHLFTASSSITPSSSIGTRPAVHLSMLTMPATRLMVAIVPQKAVLVPAMMIPIHR